MHRRWLIAAAVAVAFAFGVSRGFAGMPAELPILPTDRGVGENVVTLSTWAIQRLSAISFFAMVILLSAGAAQWIWNLLRKDFPD